VTEYWVVDPDLDLIRIYRRNGEQFDRAVELSRERGDVLTTLVLQGLQPPLQRIFRD
jgi:Uma2 family endonuclease